QAAGRTMGSESTAKEVPAAFFGSKSHSHIRAGTSSTPPPIPRVPLTAPIDRPMAKKSRRVMDALTDRAKPQYPWCSRRFRNRLLGRRRRLPGARLFRKNQQAHSLWARLNVGRERPGLNAPAWEYAHDIASPGPAGGDGIASQLGQRDCCFDLPRVRLASDGDEPARVPA